MKSCNISLGTLVPNSMVSKETEKAQKTTLITITFPSNTIHESLSTKLLAPKQLN